MKKLFLIILITTISLFISCKTDNQNNIEDEIKGETKELSIFLVKLNDAGKSGEAIGCGDSLIEIKEKLDIAENPIKTALNKLFQIKGNYKNLGLYTALTNTNFKVESIEEKNNIAIVSISGTYTISGVCEIPRIENQIKETVLKNSNLKDLQILLNGKPMEEVFSLK
ncbi:MAG: GerMN domain-containing protein [Candidatus Woesearchaeota archaeon]|jgi:hypothetical protein